MKLAALRPVAALAAALTLATGALAQSPNILTFDDLPGVGPVPAGYGGIPDWGSWESTDVADPDYPFQFSLAHIRTAGTQQRIRFGGDSYFLGAEVITEAPFRWKGYRLGQLVATSPTVQPNLGGPAESVGFTGAVVVDELEIETTGAHGVDFFTWLPVSVGGIGIQYCDSLPNVTGAVGSISAIGASSVLLNDLTLVATDLPPGQFGSFITSRSSFFAPVANGVLCIGGPSAPIGRFVRPGEVQLADAGGLFSLAIDLTDIPDGGSVSAVLPGETWHFQAWFREPAGAGFNFTSAIEVFFTP